MGALIGFYISKRISAKSTKKISEKIEFANLTKELADVRASISPISTLLPLATQLPELKSIVSDLRNAVQNLPQPSFDLSYEMQRVISDLLKDKLSPQVIQALAGDIQESEYQRHSKRSSEEKEAIGRYVASKWGFKKVTILLDAGTTTERVARYLATRDVKGMVICTANLVAALHFMIRGRQRCFLFPGEVDADYAGTISSTEHIESIVNLAEITVSGEKAKFKPLRRRIGMIGALPIMPTTGPCSIEKKTVHIKRTLIELCPEIVLAVDFSKFIDEGSYDETVFPVFEDPSHWEKLLTGKTEKRITIVTCLPNDDEENIKKLEKLRGQYFGTIDCISLG